MAGGELKINVGDLDAGGKQFFFPLRAAWIRGVLEDHEATARGPDGSVDVRASRSGNDVVVHGSLKAALEVPCARCLKPVPLDIDQTLSLLFVPGKTTPLPEAKADKRPAKEAASESKRGAHEGRGPKPARKADLEEYELSPEDADTFPFEGDVIVLDDVIRDELILETPIFPLCSEDCPGMSLGPSSDSTRPGGTTTDATKKAPDEAAPPSPEDIDPRLRPLLGLRGKPDRRD